MTTDSDPQSADPQYERIDEQVRQYLDSDPAAGLAFLDEFFSQPPEALLPRERADLTLTRGRLHLKLANYGEAIHHFREALELYEQARSSDRIASARSYIGITYGHIGEYALSLEHLFEALKEAQEAGDRLSVAEITNDISYTYVILGQPDLAIPHLYESIATLREFGDRMRLSWALDSLGMAYLRSGEPARALQYELESIELATSLENWQTLSHYLVNAGEMNLALGESEAAFTAFTQSLEVARAHNFRAEIAVALVQIGRLYIEQHAFEQAQAALEEALEIAEQTGRVQEKMDACKALSEVFEKTGQTARALDQYKLYHAASQRLYDEQADRRIKNLQVLHQLEQVRQEAHAFQQQTLELKREIEEQKRTQVLLEKLAQVDSLTNALNRRAFFEAGQQAFEEARKECEPLTVIMLDLDNFKEVNDRFGHLTGDQVLAVLAERIRHRLRSGDTLARYGGEEFVILLPNLPESLAVPTAERVRQAVCETPLLVGHTVMQITVSLGTATAKGPFYPTSFKELLNRADQALYAAKNAGRNCVRAYPG